MALPVVRTVRTVRAVRPTPVFVADLDRQFDQLARAFFGLQPTGRRPAARRAGAPVDVATTDEAYTVTVELPGLKREEIAVELTDDTLSVRGEYVTADGSQDGSQAGSQDGSQDGSQEPAQSTRSGRRSGRVDLRRTVPADVDRDGVEASLADGVLTVTLPRLAAPAPRRIEIAAA